MAAPSYKMFQLSRGLGGNLGGGLARTAPLGDEGPAGLLGLLLALSVQAAD